MMKWIIWIPIDFHKMILLTSYFWHIMPFPLFRQRKVLFFSFLFVVAIMLLIYLVLNFDVVTFCYWILLTCGSYSIILETFMSLWCEKNMFATLDGGTHLMTINHQDLWGSGFHYPISGLHFFCLEISFFLLNCCMFKNLNYGDMVQMSSGLKNIHIS